MANREKVPLRRVVELFALGLALASSACARPSESTPSAGSAAPLAQGAKKVASPPPKAGYETAILAGGCFWGMEEILRDVPGVIETEVGYTGGTSANPSYRDVSSGDSGHAEAVRIVFDPKRLAYAELLEKWFFRMHDPTTLDRQGNDVGPQYRSAIFVSTDEQRRVAEAVKRKLDESGKWRAKIVTQIVAAGAFTPAEQYHQDYLDKNPGGYTCHYIRDI
jgi:peptide methionine sulfoxide reductase msrA/msrB